MGNCSPKRLRRSRDLQSRVAVLAVHAAHIGLSGTVHLDESERRVGILQRWGGFLLLGYQKPAVTAPRNVALDESNVMLTHIALKLRVVKLENVTDDHGQADLAECKATSLIIAFETLSNFF